MYKWTDENGRVHYSDRPHKSSKVIAVDKSGNVSTSNSTKGSQLSSSQLLNVRLIKLLNSSQFIELNKILSKLDLDFQKSIKNEYKLYMAYDSFNIPDESYSSLFNRWVKATPNSYIPYLARAKYRYAIAWKVRGGSFSNRTSEKSMRGMRENFETVSIDLEKALSLNKESMIAHEIIISIARSRGADVEAEAVLRAALKKYPASFYLRRSYLWSIAPKWSGSHAEMQAFVNEAAQFITLNPRLKFLESEIYIDKGDALSYKKDYELASLMYQSGIGFGDYARAFYVRGKNYTKLKQYKKSVESLTKAINTEPEWPDFYYWRSKAFVGLEKYEEATKDLNTAYALKPYDEAILKAKKRLSAQLASDAYDLTDEGDNTDSIIEKYTVAIKGSPEMAELYGLRASAYFDKRKHALALQDIKKAIELDPDNFNFYHTLDYLVVRSNKDWPLIISYWEKYIELKPNDARAYAEIGGSYYHYKDFESAKKYTKKAADMGNNDGLELYNILLKGK